MLVIISDLHLTDGTTGKTINAGAFRVFRERLRDLAYDASWRADGTYHPIESMDVVLLGDVFDHIFTTRWNEVAAGESGYAKPWDDPHSELFINKFREINQAILTHNAESFAILKSLNDGQTITIPPATQSYRPAAVSREPDDPARRPVEIRLHYLVGNHDWYFHLPGDEYNQIRQEVIDALGLANTPDPFPHDLSPEIEDIYRRHNVFARHGDIYDPLNYDQEKGRLACTLGDALVVELFARFPQEIARQTGSDLPAAFTDGLKELANVTPSILVPTWIAGLMNQTGLNQSQQKRARAIWNELADQFLDLDFVRRQDTYNPFETVDMLQKVVRFSKGIHIQYVSNLATWIQRQIWGGSVSFADYALKEAAIKNKTARAVVYGHTHFQEVIPLSASPAATGTRFDQMYINSGTWHAIHRLAQRDPDAGEFVSYNVMTYLAFYQNDERGGRAFETWSGTLDHMW